MRELFVLPSATFLPLQIGDVVLPFTPVELLLQLVLPVVGVTVVIALLRRGVARGVARLPLAPTGQQNLQRWLRRGLHIAGGTINVLLLARLFGAELLRWLGVVYRVLNEPFFTSGATAISLVTIVLVFPVFYLAGWIARMTQRTVERNIVDRLNLDMTRRFTLLSVLRFFVLGVAVVVGLSMIGINLSSLTVIFGVLGIGLGFGLQEVVGNAFAGIVIIFTNPIKEGDRILVGEIEGTVQQIRLIQTIVDTVTHETLIIPNSKITGNLMHNYSYSDISIIICNTVQVSYRSDLDRVGEVLSAVARRNPWAIPHEEPRYRVASFDDSGITVRICTWITDARERMAATSWNNLEIWRAFRDEGIEIPYPQLDLHVKEPGGIRVMSPGDGANAPRDPDSRPGQTEG